MSVASRSEFVRVQHNSENPFFMLNRTACNDVRLSYKAIGLHTYLLSKPDNWQISMSDLINRHTDGETSVRSGLDELEQNGYVQRFRQHDDGGRFIWITQVLEVPNTIPRKSPDGTNRGEIADLPSGGFPHMGNPYMGNPGQEKKEQEKTEGRENEKVSASADAHALKSDETSPRRGNRRKSTSRTTSNGTPSEGGFPLDGERKSRPKTKPTLLAEKLGTFLLEKRLYTNPSGLRISKWSEDLRMFSVSSDIDISEIEETIDWYIEHFGDHEFIPRVYSMNTFIEKYPKIRNQMERSGKATVKTSESGYPEKESDWTWEQICRWKEENVSYERVTNISEEEWQSMINAGVDDGEE